MPSAMVPSRTIKYLVEQSIWAEPFRDNSLSFAQLSNGNIGFICFAEDGTDLQAFAGISSPNMNVPAQFALSFGGPITSVLSTVSPLNDGRFVCTAEFEPDEYYFQWQRFNADGTIATGENVLAVPELANGFVWMNTTVYPAMQGANDAVIFPVGARPENPVFQTYDAPWWYWPDEEQRAAIWTIYCDDLAPDGIYTVAQTMRAAPEEAGAALMRGNVIWARPLPNRTESVVLIEGGLGFNGANPSLPIRYRLQGISETGAPATYIYEFPNQGSTFDAVYPLQNLVGGKVSFIVRWNDAPNAYAPFDVSYNGGTDLDVVQGDNLPFPSDAPPGAIFYYASATANSDGSVWIFFNMTFDGAPALGWCVCRYSAAWELIAHHYPWPDGADYLDVNAWRGAFEYPQIYPPYGFIVPGPTPAQFSMIGPLMASDGGSFLGFAQQLWAPYSPRSNIISYPLLAISMKCVPCADVMLDGLKPSFPISP